MFEITYHNDELAVSSDTPFIPAVRGFLRKQGFVESEDRHMIAKIDSPHDTIVSVQEMIGMYDQCRLDSNCQKILDEAENARQEFQDIISRVRTLKSNNSQKYWEETDVQVSQMSPGISLKWYQRMPVMHAVMLGNSANFSVPGSGKTWMGYSTFFKLKHEKNKVDKLLIVAPIVAFRPWETEYTIMTENNPSRIVRITGTPDRRKHLFEYTVPHYDMFLISHTMVVKEETRLIEMMSGSRFMVIVDESHNIKRHDGQRATALHRIAPYAKSRMILTGTPMPKGIDDLWSQFTFLYPDNSLLSTWHQYEWRCKSPDALEVISSEVKPYFVRISKDMLNLPEPVFNPANANGLPTRVEMGAVQRRIYDAIAVKIRDNMGQFRGDVVALERFRKNAMIYLIEAATDPSLLTKDTTYQDDDVDSEGLDILELLEKYPRLRDEKLNKLETAKRMAMETLDVGGKVIIWCSFINTIKKMSKYMEDAGYKSVMVWGGIPRDTEADPEFNREDEIEKFKTNSTYNVLIANPSSLAESISLHKHCHHTIYVDRTFNGAHYMQSLDRIHRVGLDPGTLTRYDILQSERSIDQTIHERLMLKQARMEKFLKQDTLEVYAIDDEEAPADGFDEGYEDDFNAVIKDIGSHVGNI